MNQSYKNIEVVVVDDGSSDNTKEVIAGYGNDVRYCYKPNGGAASARNHGIIKAKGKYIAFLDSDDYWIPDKINAQMELACSDPNIGLIYSDARWTDINDRGLTRKQMVNVFYRGNAFKEVFLLRSFITTSTVMVKRECFDDVGLFDERMSHAEDGDMWLRIARRYELDYVDRVLAFYRMDTNSSLSREPVAMLSGCIRSREKAMKEGRREVEAFYREAKQYLAHLYYCLGKAYMEAGAYDKTMINNMRSLRYRPYAKRPFFYLFIAGIKYVLGGEYMKWNTK